MRLLKNTKTMFLVYERLFVIAKFNAANSKKPASLVAGFLRTNKIAYCFKKRSVASVPFASETILIK